MRISRTFMTSCRRSKIGATAGSEKMHGYRLRILLSSLILSLVPLRLLACGETLDSLRAEWKYSGQFFGPFSIDELSQRVGAHYDAHPSTVTQLDIDRFSDNGSSNDEIYYLVSGNGLAGSWLLVSDGCVIHSYRDFIH